MSWLADRLMAVGVAMAEHGAVPDTIIRAAMRKVIQSRLETVSGGASSTLQEATGPIAEDVDTANQQHYEVPPEFFTTVLGPRLKYSCAYWGPEVDDLAAAEEAMLELYCERASLSDGQIVLDLGCGWGSFSLWAAERFPNSEVFAVSNSRMQGEYIEKQAADSGLDNIHVETADVNRFDPTPRFDRIVSIEMLEHVRNHRLLFSRAASWLAPDGLMFTHVFAHQEHAYVYEPEGPADWMARTFFTGGVMPSRSLLPRAAAPDLTLDREWWVPGGHYSRTLEAWLESLDTSRHEVEQILAPVHGDGAVLVQRWRMFFMACSEMFAFDAGRQWGVVHQRFRAS